LAARESVVGETEKSPAEVPLNVALEMSRVPVPLLVTVTCIVGLGEAPTGCSPKSSELELTVAVGSTAVPESVTVAVEEAVVSVRVAGDEPTACGAYVTMRGAEPPPGTVSGSGETL
jgi:hypothetical protein